MLRGMRVTCWLVVVLVARLLEAQTAPYPPSSIILGISFDLSTLVELAPGSDNWPVTWADDDHQYTSWGDGGGFGGTNNDGRVSLGFGRVEGSKDSYQGFNVWGGKNPENSAEFNGKSRGIISIGGILYMWRGGAGSGAMSFDFDELYQSTDHAASWQFTGVRFDSNDFPNSEGIFATTFLQFGRDYGGARDGYVYTYAPENKDGVWEVQTPGEIALLRVPIGSITNESSYEFFAGLDGQGQPQWSSAASARQPVFEDAVNGVMRTSVSYNPGIGRYILITQQVSRYQSQSGHIGIYDAPEPWGPWTTVLLANPWTLGLQNGSKTVFWNFSNKWLSQDGLDFVLVYTGDGADNWGSLEGTFTVAPPALPGSSRAGKTALVLLFLAALSIAARGVRLAH